MKAIILCGGSGKDMSPLSDLRPKTSLLLMGRPIFQYAIDGLSQAGVDEFVVVVGQNGEPIINYLQTIDSNLRFTVVKQKKDGVEGAILSAKNEIEDPTFILAHGDIVAPARFYQQLTRTFHGGADGSIAVTLKSSISDFGLISISDSGYVTHVIEHPGQERKDMGNYIGAGAYIFPKEFLNELEKSKNSTFDNTINTILNQGHNIKASVFSEEDMWMDIGNPYDLLTATRIVFSEYSETRISASSQISHNAHIDGPVVIEAGATIDHGAVIKGPVYIGKNVYVGTNCLIRDHTAIEEKCVIGFSVEMTRSHIQPLTTIGRLSFIGDSIIGRKAEIRSGVTIANELPSKNHIFDVRGSVFTKAGAVIGDEASIGANVVLASMTVVGTYDTISPGIVYSNQPERLKAKVKEKKF